MPADGSTAPLPHLRCRHAIAFGVTLHTRCFHAQGHEGSHVGNGLPEFEYQRIEWFDGDRRDYQTDYDAIRAWEQYRGPEAKPFA